MRNKSTAIYHYKILYLFLIFIVVAQISLHAENKKYDKYGIIIGKDVHMQSRPYGTTMNVLKEGEAVFILKKDSQKNVRGKADYWYKISTLKRQIGWVKEESVYYLDETIIPEKYYSQAFGRLYEYQKDYSLYHVRFEYYKEYNMLIYRFIEIDPPVFHEAMTLYEIKNEKARCVSSYHDYNSKIIINDKFVFVIEVSGVTVYDRNKTEDVFFYKSQAHLGVPNYETIIKESSGVDFNKSDNCYDLKIRIGDKYGRNIREDLYKFDGENLKK